MKRHTYRKSACVSLVLAAALAVSVPAASYGATGPGSGQSSQTSETALQSGTQSTEAEVPEVASQGAVLYDVTHNRFLFEKNADTRYYPASITKLMTALLVAENCSLNDTVTFSETAVSRLESGAVTLQVKAGDQFSVKDCMYGLLLKSANEVANGLAEHVSGSIEAFAQKMNQRAADLGCTNTHFVNPNGLNHQEHYTTARDMALIAGAAFANDTVRQVASTLKYDFPASASVPSVRHLTMGHKMLNPAQAEYYPGFVAGKTGFTSLAGNTLVTCAQKDGVRLIAVILKSSQTHYTDTKKLLDYGFQVAASGGAAGPGAGNGSDSQSGSGSQSSTQNAYPGQNASFGHSSTQNISGQGSVNQSTGNQSSSRPVSGQTAAGPGQSGNGTQQNGSQTAAVGREAYPEAAGTWLETGSDWKFLKQNGSYAAGEYLRINGEVYGFEAGGLMLRGWHLVNGTWHCFEESGAMAFEKWIQTNGLWYYVDQNGSLFVNGTTPDGYRVDQNGVWIR